MSEQTPGQNGHDNVTFEITSGDDEEEGKKVEENGVSPVPAVSSTGIEM